jgi:hypothetical protein
MKLPFNETINLWIHRRYRELLWPNFRLHAIYLAMQGRRVETDGAAIAVEGFGRSGNTFAANALHLTQPEPFRIISHFHYPIAIGRPAEAGVPVCLVLRTPIDSIISYCQYGDWGPQRFIDDFLAYHRYVLPWLDQIAVVRFEDFTKDFNHLIHAVNKVYGPILHEITNNEELREQTFKQIEENQPGGRIDELQVHRPSEVRKQRKPEIEADIKNNYAEDLAKVMALYEPFFTRAEALQRD